MIERIIIDQQEVRGINKHLLPPAPFGHIGFIIIMMNIDKYFILTIRCSVSHMCFFLQAGPWWSAEVQSRCEEV